MPYEIAMKDSFLTDLLATPKHVQKEFSKVAIPIIQGYAEKHNNIKKLTNFKNFWRYRLARDYRIIYQVEKQRATLWMLGNRKDVYERFNFNPDDEEPGNTILSQLPDLLDPLPSPAKVGLAVIQANLEEQQKGPAPNPLPISLSVDNLTEWGIPKDFHATLQRCHTDNDLEGADVPPDVLSKIINIIFPPKIEAVANSPSRIVQEPEDFEKALLGHKNLTSFLLALDEKQKGYVDNFSRKDGVGPWILKGGPGSGKSTIALYCIRSLLSNKLDFAKPQRILFTTYTNSLTGASQQLIRSLLLDDNLFKIVDIKTMNSLAALHADPNSKKLSIAKNEEVKKILIKTIHDLRTSKKIASFDVSDNEFILEEIEWVILGDEIQDKERYLSTPRRGRGRQLGKIQRNDLWEIYESFNFELNKEHLITHDQVVIEAHDKAKSLPNDKKYDFVFVEEAQDFKPIGIAFCVELAKDPKNVFLTADMNQAVYGRGVSWVSVHQALRFTKEKSEELQVNYRSTREIVSAIKEIAEQIEDRDPATLILNTPFRGDPPIINYCADMDHEAHSIHDFILSNLKKLNMCLGCAAILCRNNRDAKDIVQRLPQELKARYMKTKQIEVDYNGVKVITIHAAKGLEFPVVVVARVNGKILPGKCPAEQDQAEHSQAEWKLFFVACSRAMRALQVTTTKNNSSPFLQSLTSENWSTIGLD